MDAVIAPRNGEYDSFFSAVKENDRKALMKLISSSHMEPRFITNERRETLLHIATKLGLFDMVRILVDIYQLCPFEVDQSSNTSVHYACQYKHLSILAYFFRIGSYACMNDLHHGNTQVVIPNDFESHLLSVTVSSDSSVILRFAYTLLVFNLNLQSLVNVKLNLFLDTFHVLSRVIDPRRGLGERLECTVRLCNYAHRGNLNFFRFVFNELAQPCCLPLSNQINEQFRWGYTSCLQRACRLDDLDSALCKDYLIKTIGLNPASEPSTYSISLITLEPFKHSQCYKRLDSPLHTAVLCGNTNIVRDLMAPTGNLFHTRHHLITKHGTLLHSACMSGSIEIVEMMIRELDFACDVNVQNSLGNTALHVACEWGWLEIVQYLCECNDCNMNINISNFHGYSPFTLAIKHNRLEIFKYFCTLGTIDVNVQSTDTLETPLHLACCCESPEFASALLDDDRYTTSLDAVDKYGDTPLFNVCRVGNIKVIQKLISMRRCNCLYVNNITKETPAHIACRKNRLDILQLLFSEGVTKPLNDEQYINYLGKSLFHIACDNDSEEIVDFLIDNAMNTEFHSNIGGVLMSPIHIACAHDNVKVLMKLVRSQICKTTDKDKNGNNIFHYICTREQVSYEMIKIFSMNEVSKELIVQTNLVGRNSLHLICENDAVQVLDCFVRQLNVLEQINVALCSSDREGNTPLHISIIRKRTLVLRYLMNASEVANGISKALCTQNSYHLYNPLHLVCRNIQLEYARFIVGSPYLSQQSIREAVIQLDHDGNNIFHIIFGAIHSHGQPLLQLFGVFMQLAGCKLDDETFVQALCMQSEQCTPLQNAFRGRITDEMFGCVLSLFISKLSIESVKTICSAPHTGTGDTLLHLIAQMIPDMFNSAKMLIENQLCDPQKTNNYNQTSLHLICKVGSNEADKTSLYLCMNGCDVHQLDDFGHSAASYAFQTRVALLKEMIATGYCSPVKGVQSLEQLNDYCHIMGSHEELKIQLPLLHLVVCRYGFKSDEITDFLLSQHDFSPNVIFDSFENTFFHLKSNPYQLLNRLKGICNHNYFNKQNKEGNTPLHLACATGNKLKMKFLIESEKCSESLFKRNVYGYTPLYYAQNRDMINCLILNGADPKDAANSASVHHITQTFEKLKGENPLHPTVTVLVLGNSMAGKTTLIKSLTKAYRWEFIEQPSIGQIKDVVALEDESGRTAGVEISEYKVSENDEVRILFYDFAGHPEFESTHSILLQNLLSSSERSAFLFLVVVDIKQHNKLTQLIYWAKFIENCESSFAIGKSEMIVIGSHIDKIPEEIMHKPITESINKTLKSFSLESVENPILLDCRHPKVFELQRVKALLMESTKNLKEQASLDIRSHLVFAYLYEHFPDKPVKFSVLQRSLKEKKLTGFDVSELLFTKIAIIDLLKGMHYRQHILLIGLHQNLPEGDFWILTAKARSLMFHKINGVLFASEDDFNRSIKIRSNVGVLPSSVFMEEFPDIEYDLLQQFLEYSELCKKISDTEILNLIEGRSTESDSNESAEEKMEYEHSSDQMGLSNVDQATTINSNDEYFFIPGLIKEKQNLHNIWKSNEGYSYAAGWSLQCTENSFFDARFLQVLLLRLVFQFAVESPFENLLHRKCKIWKNGVFWSTKEVEMLAEVVNQNQAVNVLVRCFEDTELEAVRLRTAILKEVLKVKEKHCPKTKVIEYIMYDPHFNDKGSLSESVQKVDMRELIRVIIKGSHRVQSTSFQYHVINKSLLCFEPYVGIGDELLTLLFDIDKANEIVPEDVMLNIVNLQERAFAQSRHTDFLIQQVNRPVVYQDLRKLFDKYSVFHGRNPKVSL